METKQRKTVLVCGVREREGLGLEEIARRENEWEGKGEKGNRKKRVCNNGQKLPILIF